jgi:hypothetical protein
MGEVCDLPIGHLKTHKMGPDIMTHARNPRYSGGRYSED